MLNNTCPCPCPIQKELATSTEWGFTVEKLNTYHKPGDKVKSPGGTFEYEILSYPQSRLYYDVKGEFEKYSWKKLLEEKNEEAELFLGQFKDAGFIYPPSFERLVNTLTIVYYMLSNLNNIGYLFTLLLHLTHKPMCHKDNNPWQQDDKGKWIKGNYPCSYLVKLPGLNYRPHIRTLRW